MRTINYKEWKKQRGEVHSRILQLNSQFSGRASSNRPRDPEKENALIEMDKARFQSYIDSGKIVIVNPRKWIYKIW
jgi:hypothetical protein